MNTRQTQLKKAQVRGTGTLNLIGEKDKSKFPAALRGISALN